MNEIETRIHELLVNADREWFDLVEPENADEIGSRLEYLARVIAKALAGLTSE